MSVEYGTTVLVSLTRTGMVTCLKPRTLGELSWDLQRGAAPGKEGEKAVMSEQPHHGGN